MNERDFQIGARKYKVSKIDAFKQFHIARRLGPIMGDIIPVAQKLQAKFGALKPDEMKEDQLEAVAAIAQPVLVGFSRLSDDDANKILLGLCSAVEMQQTQAGGWAKVSTESQLMFQDLELPELMQIAGRAFMFNIAGFFKLAPQVSHGGK